MEGGRSRLDSITISRNEFKPNSILQNCKIYIYL